MQILRKRIVAAAATLGLLIVIPSHAHAQFQVSPFQRNVNLNPYIAPGLTLQQYLFNVRQVGSAFQGVPPQLLGFNPFIRPNVVLNAPTFGTPGVSPIISPIVSPYNPFTNPYAPGLAAPGATTNPYVPATSAYDPSLVNPYTPYVDPYGGQLRGAADVLRAHSSGVLNAEQARILREQARRERIKTNKELYEFEWWLKANTPSFAEVQAKIDRDTLKRIQGTNNLPEIWGGRSLNILLDDLRKHVGKKMTMEQLILPEDVLQHLNVTGEFGNLGLLRTTGRFEWPSALQEILTKVEQKEVENVALALINQAFNENGKVDGAGLRNLRTYLEKIEDKLTKKVNEVRTPDYLHAKRFLADFKDAHIALEKNQAVPYFKFHQFVRTGPKNVQEVADYMVKHGLHFARATPGDEAAYQAMHTAMVAYDLIFNTHSVASAAPTPGYEDKK